MSETSMPQGELRIGRIVHGAAMNCLIIPADNPDDWYMKQFFSTKEIEQYAAEFDLVIVQEKTSEDDTGA